MLVMDKTNTNWKVRRTLMFFVTSFCMWIIWTVIDSGMDTETAQIALKYSFWIIFSVLAIYVFGVITDEQVSRLLDSKIGDKK